MLRFYISCLAPLLGLAFMPTSAKAQYYTPVPTHYLGSHQLASHQLGSHQQDGHKLNPHHPGGLGLDLGLRNSGLHPSVGVGIGQVGTGAGAGLGLNGLGAGVNTGLGPLGVSTNTGLGWNGLGAEGNAGIGNTGAAFEAGLSQGGLGLGANAKVLGLGGGASAGIGRRGPGVGASLAFGNFGTLLIGSHRNSYPGAQQTAAYTQPGYTASYYRPQNYGNVPYYQTAPKAYHKRPAVYQDNRHQVPRDLSVSACPAPWTC